MLQRSAWARCMSVGTACRTMGFRAPPKDQKELKTRFLALTKQHHPDQNSSTGSDSTQKMVDLTEAYKTLKKLMDAGGGVHARDVHSAVSAMQQRRARGGEADAAMEEVAASFVVPGASLSLRGLTLPWQRMATRSKVAQVMERLDDSRDINFGEYVSAVRAVEAERSHRAAARSRDAKAAEGSHGFTAEYFDRLHEARCSLKGDAEGTEADDLGKRIPTGLLPLALRFYGRRLSAAVRRGPRLAWDTLRYVVSGH